MKKARQNSPEHKKSVEVSVIIHTGHVCPFDRVCIMSINCVTSFEYRGNVLYEKHKYSENARLYILIKKGMPL